MRRRRRYPATGAGAGGQTRTAPPPPTLLPKSPLGTSVWVEVLPDKYARHRPTERLLAAADASAQRIQELLAQLDDDPDLLHFDHTPPVGELIEIGEPAIEPTLPYLLSEDEATRLHAHRVVEGAVLRMHGFVHGHGWSRPDAEQEFNRFYHTLWDYRAMGRKQVYEATLEARRAYIERVKQWLASRRT